MEEADRIAYCDAVKAEWGLLSRFAVDDQALSAQQADAYRRIIAFAPPQHAENWALLAESTDVFARGVTDADREVILASVDAETQLILRGGLFTICPQDELEAP